MESLAARHSVTLTDMNLKNTLFALSNILDAAEGSSRLTALDLESRAILRLVGTSTSAGHEVCIKDITTKLQPYGSAVTLVKRIQGLCHSGWLVQGTSQLHHRRVTLRLSAKAQREFNAMSAQIEAELAQFVRQQG